VKEKGSESSSTSRQGDTPSGKQLWEGRREEGCQDEGSSSFRQGAGAQAGVLGR